MIKIIKITWNGKGFLHNVPARDLSEEDIKKFDLDEEKLLSSGLYSLVEEPSEAEDKEPEEKAQLEDIE